MLHAGNRVLGQLLAGPTRHPRPGVPGGDHAAHHVHPDLGYLRPAAPGLLHQGYRRVDRRLSGEFLNTILFYDLLILSVQL